MPLPVWPDVPNAPQVEGFQLQPWGLSPIITEMEGGNVHARRRPGDDTQLISQHIRMTNDQLAVFKAWFSATLGGGTGRFRADVWTGTAFENKVCQFNLSSSIQYAYVTEDQTDVVMQLRAYGA